MPTKKKPARAPVQEAPLTIAVSALEQLVATAARFAPAKSPLPICSHVHIHATNGGITVRATDLETALTVCASVQHPAELNAVVLPKPLLDVLKGMRAYTDVELSLADNRLAIKAGGQSVQLLTMRPEDFPAIPLTSTADAVHVPVATWKDLVDRTAYAACRDDTRPILMGVLVTWDEAELSMTATDGFTLARATASVPQTQRIAPFEIIIPARALEKLTAIAVGKVILSVDRVSHAAHITTDAWVAIQRLIEGTFPNWRSIVPKAFGTEVEVDPAQLLAACEMVLSGRNTKAKASQPIYMNVDGAIVLGSHDDDVGTATASVPCVKQGKDVLTAYRASQLRAAVKALFPSVKPSSLAASQPVEPAPAAPEVVITPTKDPYKSEWAQAIFNRNRMLTKYRDEPLHEEVQKATARVEEIRRKKDDGYYERLRTTPTASPPAVSSPPARQPKTGTPRLVIRFTGDKSVTLLERTDSDRVIQLVMPMPIEDLPEGVAKALAAR